MSCTNGGKYKDKSYDRYMNIYSRNADADLFSNFSAEEILS